MPMCKSLLEQDPKISLDPPAIPSGVTASRFRHETTDIPLVKAVGLDLMEALLLVVWRATSHAPRRNLPHVPQSCQPAQFDSPLDL
jgi:hypothetical protein